MRSSPAGILLLALAATAVAAQAQSAAPVSVTLFNSGRVLVRRTLNVALAAGTTTSNVPIGVFTPSTFASLEPGVRVLGLRSEDAISEDALLRRNVGRTFDVDTSAHGTRRATLLSLDPERWQWVDAPGVRFGRPGRIVWPRELVPSQIAADVSFVSDRARSTVRVMYETQGAAWSASYQLFLGTGGHIDGAALISSGVLDLADAEVQLLSGDIGRGAPPAAKSYAAAAPMAMRAAESFADVMQTQQSVGETHIYTLPGRSTFVPGSSFTMALFDPVAVHGDRRYYVNGALPFYGGYAQQADEQSVGVNVAYHVDRKLNTPFGDLALPPGYVAIYDYDKGGRVQLIGQGSINHTAPGIDMLVDAGTAFDVTARRVQTEFSTARTGTTPARTIATSGYRVTLYNARDSAVKVDVREDRSGEWSVIESSLPGVRQSSTRTVFTVPVAPRDSTVLTYRVRVQW